MDKVSWLSLVTWILAVYWQPSAPAQTSRPLRNSLREGRKGTGRRRRLPAFLSPPPWLFGVAWSILYALMSASIFLYWNRDGVDPHTRTMVLVLVNLLLNKAWTPVFVGGQRLLALFILVAIVGTNVWLHVEWFAQPDGALSSWLWLPYTVWTVYASALNIALL